MWNSGFYGITGYGGAWNVMGEMLGLIWILGIAVATIAWFTLPSRHGDRSRDTGRAHPPKTDELLRHGGD